MRGEYFLFACLFVLAFGIKAEKYTNSWVVVLHSENLSDGVKVAKDVGMTHVKQLSGLPRAHVLSHDDDLFKRDPRSTELVQLVEKIESSLRDHNSVDWFIRDSYVHHQRSLPTDPLFNNQWHLVNTGQVGPEGIDVKITPVWDQGLTGKGVVIGIADDGLQYTHPDLSPNYIPSLSHNWNSGNPLNPSPNVSADYHGTACAGVAAASNNSACGVGAAYEASLVGLRFLSQPVTYAAMADMLSWEPDAIHIHSNSWGPGDDSGYFLIPAHPLETAAWTELVTKGRGGKGRVFFFASANNNFLEANCNYNGYCNSIRTISIGAVDSDGKSSYYSNTGAPLAVSAPSSGYFNGIVTTDLLGTDGYNQTDCTFDFGGTSSATPLVAGIAALILQNKPELSWRDVLGIIIQSAFKIDENDTDWTTNGAGFHINHKYGFGMVDASASIALSNTWTPLDFFNSFSGSAASAIAIPESRTASTSAVSPISIATQETVEQVEIFVKITHPSPTELDITLISPNGTKSVLSPAHGFYSEDCSLRLPDDNVVIPAICSPLGPQLFKEQVQDVIIAISDGCSSYTVTPGTVVVVPLNSNCTYFRQVYEAELAGAGGVIYAASSTVTNETIAYYDGSFVQWTIPTMILAPSQTATLANYLTGPSIRAIMQNNPSKLPAENFDLSNGWTFTSLRHWGERSNGDWKLQVVDRLNDGNTGTLNQWSINIWHNSKTVPAPTSTTSSAVVLQYGIWAIAAVLTVCFLV